jgi:hypothetical protein
MNVPTIKCCIEGHAMDLSSFQRTAMDVYERPRLSEKVYIDKGHKD